MIKRVRKLLYRTMQMRILFASIIVLILILLLALTVNNAREKEMVDLFSRQQLASAQNAAIRMTDIFVNVGKNISLFSYFDPQGNNLLKDDDPHSEILYAGWDTTVNAIMLFDSNGIVRHALPPGVLPTVNMAFHFQALRQQQRQYSSLVLSEKLSHEQVSQKSDWYLIWGYPIWRDNRYFDGAWMVAFSMASLVDLCEKQIRDNRLGEMWLVDDQGMIILHPDGRLIGGNLNDFLRNNNGEDLLFPSPDGRHLDAATYREDQKVSRSVIAYYPVQAGDYRWFIMVSAPYREVVAPVRTTFLYTLFSAMILILVVVVSGISYAFHEGKRIRMNDERERLREREAWQEKLLREKKTIEGIIEGSPIPSFVINNEHRVILWNRACSELTGYSAQEMLGTDNHYKPFYTVKRPVIADLIVDNDLEGLNQFYGTKKVKKSEKIPGAYEANDYFEHLGGRSRFMYFLASPIYDDEGRIIAAIETLQDVSREEELSQSLREYAETLQNELSENIELRREIEELYNYLQSIVRSLPDKIYDLDKNGIVNFVSRGLKKEFGQAHRGKHFLDFVDPGNVDFILSKWEEAKKGIYAPYEIESSTQDGKKVNLLVSTSPVHGTDHFILVQRDITEFKSLEKKLYESRKLAALGQLSAGIAHEVRNPLSSIKMSLQILEKRMNPEGNDLKRFKIAQKEVEHLEELVNNVLIFAKPVEPKIARVDIVRILEQAIALAEKLIHDKDIAVSLDAQGVPPVKVDAAMITDAFLNIIRNAIEAVEKEQGRVHIYARSIGSQPPSVLVVCEDNGCGIDAEDMPHLFNPFFTRKKYGTGLGLSQVVKIVEMHRGKIEIISDKDKGTKVCITLPCDESLADTREA